MSLVTVNRQAEYKGQLIVPLFEAPYQVPPSWYFGSVPMFNPASLYPTASRLPNLDAEKYQRIYYFGSIHYGPVGYTIVQQNRVGGFIASFKNSINNGLLFTYHAGIVGGHTWYQGVDSNWPNNSDRFRFYNFYHLGASNFINDFRSTIDATTITTTPTNYLIGQTHSIITTHNEDLFQPGVPFWAANGGSVSGSYNGSEYSGVLPLDHTIKVTNVGGFATGTAVLPARTPVNFPGFEIYDIIGRTRNYTLINVLANNNIIFDWSYDDTVLTRYKITFQRSSDNTLFDQVNVPYQVTSKGFLLWSATTGGKINVILLSFDGKKYWSLNFAAQSTLTNQTINTNTSFADARNFHFHIDPYGTMYFVRSTNPNAGQMFTSWGFAIPWNMANIDKYLLSPISLPCYGTCRAVPMKIGQV